jgi:hypothetical protein
VNGSGTYIWDYQDSFHFVSQPVSGDKALVARVASLTQASGTSKAGIMFRAGTSTSAANVMVTAHAGGYAEMQYRTMSGTYTSVVWGPPWSSNRYLKLARQGNTYTGYTSADGITWSQPPGWSVTINLTDVRDGLAVSAESYGALATGVFDHVNFGVSHTITSTPPGRTITVDGTACVTPCTRDWTPGQYRVFTPLLGSPKIYFKPVPAFSM